MASSGVDNFHDQKVKAKSDKGIWGSDVNLLTWWSMNFKLTKKGNEDRSVGALKGKKRPMRVKWKRQLSWMGWKNYHMGDFHGQADEWRTVSDSGTKEVEVTIKWKIIIWEVLQQLKFYFQTRMLKLVEAILFGGISMEQWMWD